MTGARIAEIMRDPEITKFLHKVARRYTSLIEDQEEYIQEGWLRIARTCEDDTPIQIIKEMGSRGINATYQTRRLRVIKNRGQNYNSIYKDDRKTRALGRGRYLVRKPEKLDPWYFHDEPGELGLDYYDFVAFYYYQILIEHL